TAEGKAHAEESRAEEQRHLAEMRFYARQLQAAQRDWDDGHLYLAREQLAACRLDFRGIEHRYLASRFRFNQVTLTGHTHAVRGVAVSRDGTRIVSASDDRTLRIWDAQTGECLRVLSGHKLPLSGLAISPDGSRIVSGSRTQSSSAKPGEV